MGGRVDFDPVLPPVRIPARVYNELCAHARETVPEECCGLIVGGERVSYDRVVKARNEMTRRGLLDAQGQVLDNRSGFFMSPEDYRNFLSPESDERVNAVYHSHVNAGAYLSQMDMELASTSPFPEADQVVIGVLADRKVKEIALFRRESVGAPFVGRRLEPEAP